jgi:hypothetical protein
MKALVLGVCLAVVATAAHAADPRRAPPAPVKMERAKAAVPDRASSHGFFCNMEQAAPEGDAEGGKKTPTGPADVHGGSPRQTNQKPATAPQ